MSANLIVLLCWTIVHPLRFERSPDSGTDPWNRVVSTTGRCKGTGNITIYLVLLSAINVAPVLLANIQAYRARHVHTELSESRYIGLIMICLLQTWFTGAPFWLLVRDNPKAFYFVVCMIVFITCAVVLFLIFYPKFSAWRKWKK